MSLLRLKGSGAGLSLWDVVIGGINRGDQTSPPVSIVEEVFQFRWSEFGFDLNILSYSDFIIYGSAHSNQPTKHLMGGVESGCFAGLGMLTWMAL